MKNILKNSITYEPTCVGCKMNQPSYYVGCQGCQERKRLATTVQSVVDCVESSPENILLMENYEREIQKEN